MKYLKLYENFINEAVASTAHIEVGEEYTYKSGIEGKPPVKIKVDKIVNDNYFVGEILEENETTEYKGWKKGEKYQLNTSNIVEESTKKLSALNKIVEPQNSLGDKIPKAKEAFDEVVNWAKENKMRTVGQSNEYGDKDIYIKLWDNGMLDVICNTANEEKVKELLGKFGKLSKTHMDDETKACRYGISF